MPTVTLVPLGLGDLLDQTFSRYRKHFWLFAGIMAFPETIIVAMNILLQVYMSRFPVPQAGQGPQAAVQAAAYGARFGVLYLFMMVPHYVVYATALGATTYALSEVYLGRMTTIRDSYRFIYSKVWKLTKVVFAIAVRSFGLFFLGGIILAFMFVGIAPLMKSMPWLGLLFILLVFLCFAIGAVLALVYLLRYSVAIPAVLLERLSTRQALQRSVNLTKGFLWRLLVVLVLMTLIALTLVSLCQMPFMVAGIFMSIKGSRPSLWISISSLVTGGVAAAAVTPLGMISFAIAYYDFRVRKEAFDLDLLMSSAENAGLSGLVESAPSGESASLEDASVAGMVVLTLLTASLYPTIWLLTRRRALNTLNSLEKISVPPLAIALALAVINLLLPVLGSPKWGSWVEGENAVAPLHGVGLAAGVILIVQCFKTRRILVDHLAPQEEGMFTASIRFQFEEMFSRVWTFFFGVFYLQHKINVLWDRLQPNAGRQEKNQVLVAQPSPFPPVVQ